MLTQRMGAGGGPAACEKATVAVHHAFGPPGGAGCVHQQSVIPRAKGVQWHLRIKVQIIGHWPQTIGAGRGKLRLLFCADTGKARLTMLKCIGNGIVTRRQVNHGDAKPAIEPGKKRL